MTRRASPRQGSPISRLPKNIPAIRAENDQKFVPRLKRRYAGYTPTTKYPPGQGKGGFRVGELIGIVCNEPVLANEVVWPVALFRIVLISIAEATVGPYASEGICLQIF